jgi:hypothetical protein
LVFFFTFEKITSIGDEHFRPGKGIGGSTGSG